MVAMLAPLPFNYVTGAEAQWLGTFCAVGVGIWAVGMATLVLATTIAKWRAVR